MARRVQNRLLIGLKVRFILQTVVAIFVNMLCIGVAIMVAVIIVVVVGSLNDWQKERQFKALNEKKEDRHVKVVRDGIEHLINIKVKY